jgi:hypothetical protein
MNTTLKRLNELANELDVDVVRFTSQLREALDHPEPITPAPKPSILKRFAGGFFSKEAS